MVAPTRTLREVAGRRGSEREGPRGAGRAAAAALHGVRARGAGLGAVGSAGLGLGVARGARGAGRRAGGPGDRLRCEAARGARTARVRTGAVLARDARETVLVQRGGGSRGFEHIVGIIFDVIISHISLLDKAIREVIILIVSEVPTEPLVERGGSFEHAAHVLDF